MPNWCQNKLTVTGPKAMLDKFIADAVDHRNVKNGDEPTELSLDKLYPTPTDNEIKNSKKALPKNATKEQKLLAALFAGSTPDWYTWRVTNWGTKWDVTAQVINHEPKKIVYEFDSAWAPPIEAFKKISNDYPDLKFALNYREDGMGYRGKTVVYDGDET